MGVKSSVVIGFFVLAGCAEGHCRRTVEPPTTAKPVSTPAEAAASVASSVASTPMANDRVIVFKYDGSKQCDQAKGQSLEASARELQGIPIFASVKKHDGQKHIQVCGGITGMVNSFEIPAKSLPLAQKRGFKKWSFE